MGESLSSGLTAIGFQNRIPNPAARDSPADSLPTTTEIPLTEASLRTLRIPGLEDPCGTARLIWAAWWASVLHGHGECEGPMVPWSYFVFLSLAHKFQFP